MATVIRPEISNKNKHWINKHRYYELKHFCRQYGEWKKAYLEIDGFSDSSSLANIGEICSSDGFSDNTARYVITKDFYARRIKMIEDAAIGADPDLYKYILKAVTEELPYTYLKTRLGIPCGRSTYYKIYRRFFWLLNETRD